MERHFESTNERSLKVAAVTNLTRDCSGTRRDHRFHGSFGGKIKGKNRGFCRHRHCRATNRIVRQIQIILSNCFERGTRGDNSLGNFSWDIRLDIHGGVVNRVVKRSLIYLVLMLRVHDSRTYTTYGQRARNQNYTKYDEISYDTISSDVHRKSSCKRCVWRKIQTRKICRKSHRWALFRLVNLLEFKLCVFRYIIELTNANEGCNTM